MVIEQTLQIIGDYLTQTDFTQPINFVLLVVCQFIIVAGRYVVISAAFHYYFYIYKGEDYISNRVNKKHEYSTEQYRREIAWSMVTNFIFAIIGAVVIVLRNKGLLPTQMYYNVSDYGIMWIPLSFTISMLIHETYYYWVHRWMHTPTVYKYIHKIHHESTATSVWTAFTFHPVESIIEAIILPAIIMILPMHYNVVVFQLLLMTITATINHLDVEIYPPGRFGDWFGTYGFIGATHHALHHKQCIYNYGLYFTFWDRIAGTESPSFRKIYMQRK